MKSLRRMGRRFLIAAPAIIGMAFGGCSESNPTPAKIDQPPPPGMTRIALTGTTPGGQNVCLIGPIEVLFEGVVVATEPTNCSDVSILVALATGNYTVRPAAGFTCESDGAPIDCTYRGPPEGVPVTVVMNENVEVHLPIEVDTSKIVEAGTITVKIIPTSTCGDEECNLVDEVCVAMPSGNPEECTDKCTPPDGECPDGESCRDVPGDDPDGICIPDEGDGGSGGAAGAAGASGRAGNGGTAGASGAAGEASAGGASGSGGAAGEGGEAGMAGEAGAAGSSEGGAAGESGAGGATGGSCDGNDANCPSDQICVNNTCVPPSSGGGTTGTGGTTGSGGSNGAGGGGALEPVPLRYTKPPGAPDPVEVLITGWMSNYDVNFGNLCNSSLPDGDPHKAVRNGDTWSCTRQLPPTWRDGDYNTVYRVKGQDAPLLPSGLDVQDYCWQPGSGYERFGTLEVGSFVLDDPSCRHQNGLTAGCNTTPSDCE